MRLWGLCLLLLCYSALAQPKDPKQIAARAIYAEGKVAYSQQKDYQKALALFMEAYRLWPDTAYLVNIGQCYRKMERYQEARDALQRALTVTTAPDERAEIEQILVDLDAKIPVKPSPPESAPSSVPSSLPTTLAASLPVFDLSFALPTATTSARDPRGLYASAAALFSLSVGSGAAAVAFGRARWSSPLISSSEAERLRFAQKSALVASGVSFAGSALMEPLAYSRAPSERATRVLSGLNLASVGLGLSSGLLSLLDARELGALRAEPDPDPLVVRPLQARQEASMRVSVVSLSFALSAGGFRYWCLHSKR